MEGQLGVQRLGIDAGLLVEVRHQRSLFDVAPPGALLLVLEAVGKSPEPLRRRLMESRLARLAVGSPWQRRPPLRLLRRRAGGCGA